jgi:hypothetical protein
VDALAAAGFDLVHAFDPATVAEAPGLAVLAGAPGALLVGNTRALWPPFSAALADPGLAADPDPLDRYTERVIGAAFPARPIFYSHLPHAGRFLPFQRLAVLAGLGALSPSQLVIHPTYGPWFALRAVVLLDGPAPARLPIAPPCTCPPACAARFAHALDTGAPTDWLAVRAACVLQAHRYSDAQIAYHYGRMRR